MFGQKRTFLKATQATFVQKLQKFAQKLFLRRFLPIHQKSGTGSFQTAQAGLNDPKPCLLFDKESALLHRSFLQPE
jgi:hypothetical protein